jgi:GTP-binding protein
MHTEFITSAADRGGFPSTDLPEFAFVGRSNVGKSSLLNKLAGARIARTSKTPGRTQLVNFFKVSGGDFSFVLADLPGYGFARAPRPVRRAWYDLLEVYLSQREPLRAVLQLVDLRRDIEDEDVQVHQWLTKSTRTDEEDDLAGLGRRVLIVGTKADKLSKAHRKPKLKKYGETLGMSPDQLLLCSSLNGLGIDLLRSRIKSLARSREDKARSLDACLADHCSLLSVKEKMRIGRTSYKTHWTNTRSSEKRSCYMWRNFHRLWLYMSLLVVLAMPGTSMAQNKSKILVLPYQAIGKGTSTEILDQTTNLLGSELEASGVSVMEGSDSIKKLGGKKPSSKSPKRQERSDPEANEKAQKLLADGRTGVEDQEFETAIRALKKAVRYIDDNGVAINDLSLLSEAYLLLATAYFQEGEEDEADDSLIKAVHYSPDKSLSSSKYPPIFIRSYDRARYNVLRRPRARLDVKAARNAQIFLDGRSMGRAPVMLKEVLPGNHWIRAQSPGEEPQVKKILVRSKRTIAVNLGGDNSSEAVAVPSDTSGLVGAIGTNELNRSHVAQLQSVGRKRGVDFVLFGGVHKTNTAYNIYTAIVNVQSGDVGRLTNIAFDLDLLTAQIEVYKLADDVREQTQGEEPLLKIISATKFRLAPKLNLTVSKSRRAIAAGAAASRVRTVVAAPKAKRAPTSSPNVPPPPPTQLSSREEDSGGRAPLASKPKKSEADIYDSDGSSDVNASKGRGLVPKDESEEDAIVTSRVSTPDNEDKPFLPRKDSLAFDRDEDPGQSMWWIWVAVGVAVAGAGGTGLYFGLNDSGPQEGELTIRW